MQVQLGLISVVTAFVAVVLFGLGLVHFRRQPVGSMAEVCAEVTMWAGVLCICAVLCFAGTMLIQPV